MLKKRADTRGGWDTGAYCTYKRTKTTKSLTFEVHRLVKQIVLIGF